MTETTIAGGLVADMLRRTKRRGDWGEAHVKAWTNPRYLVEMAISQMLKGVALYVESHEARFESAVGDDYVLRGGIKDILKGLDTLLNGGLGAFDGGTLSRLIGDIALAAKIDLEE